MLRFTLAILLSLAIAAPAFGQSSHPGTHNAVAAKKSKGNGHHAPSKSHSKGHKHPK